MLYFTRSLQARLEDHLSYFPVTAILGPRQCGKTTLAKQILTKNSRGSDAVYLDLERPSDLAKLSADPEGYLRSLEDRRVCLDEIQRVPDLFPLLRSLCDEMERPGRFLVLGSASPELLRQSSETLAGRIGYLELGALTLEETGTNTQDRLWVRGGFPRSFLAPDDALSHTWRENFIQTFLERDIPQLGIRVPSMTMRHFWEMCAHVHGGLWNHTKLGDSLGVTSKTASHYLAILESAYILRRLGSHTPNVKKRLVKSPRVYVRDSGLLHCLLRIPDGEALSGHPVRGASWEGFGIEQIAAAVPDADLSFYRTSGGAEMDLVIQRGGRLVTVEFKASASPRVTRGFWHALEDLNPEHTWVAARVPDPYPLTDRVTVGPLQTVVEQVRNMLG